MTDPEPLDADDLRLLFLKVQDRVEADIDRLLRPRDDEQLADIDYLFTLPRTLPNGTKSPGGLDQVPPRYWGIAPKVRAHIHQEQKRRQEASTSDE
jgi:hypothetical protein